MPGEPCDLRTVAEKMRPFVASRVPPGDVDDVLQEVLVKVHTSAEAPSDDEPFSRWLHRVSRNVIIDHQRRRGRRDRRHERFALEPSADDPGADDDAQAVFSQFVTAFVTMLPSPYHEALIATELEGLTMREAAAREGVSEAAMKSRALRGRRMLRELFEACCEIALDTRGHIIDFAPKL